MLNWPSKKPLEGRGSRGLLAGCGAPNLLPLLISPDVEEPCRGSGPGETPPIARGVGQTLKKSGGFPLLGFRVKERKRESCVRCHIWSNGHGIQRAHILRRSRNDLRDPGHWLRRWSYF